MYKISFIGNQNIEFASKWWEKSSKLVDRGRKLAKEISEDKKAGKVTDFDRSYYESMVSQNKDAARQQKARLLSGNQNDPLLKSRADRNEESRNKLATKKQSQESSQEPKKFRAKKKIGRSNSAKPQRFETDLADAVERRSIRKRVNIQDGKVNTNPKGVSNTASKTVDSAKKVNKIGKFLGKNKLGIGLAGAAALGGIGYGIARKMRSDKGKKRGFYK